MGQRNYFQRQKLLDENTTWVRGTIFNDKLLDENIAWVRGAILCYTLNMIITKEETKLIKAHNNK